MKKLYQAKIKAELLIPAEVNRDEFLKLIDGGEAGLISNNIEIVVAESPDDAILKSLSKYIEKTISGIEDYNGIIQRGETRDKYYINVSITSSENSKPLQTKIAISIIPEDLGV